MKIRRGFISNSSSSSSIIAIDENYKICPTCGHEEPNLIKMIEKSKEQDTYIHASGKQDIINFIDENWTFDKKDLLKLSKDMNDIIEIKNKNLYLVEIDYNDIEIDEIIEKYRKNGKLTLIYNDGNE